MAYTFIKRAAISTDYEAARNNAYWHPRAWINKLQDLWSNKLLAEEADDWALTKGLKRLGRFTGDDILLSLLKNVVGTADIPIRLSTSIADALSGRISGKELGARALDSGSDAFWTLLAAFPVSHVARVGLKGAARAAKGFVPKSAARASKLVADKTYKTIVNNASAIKDVALKDKAIIEGLNTLGKLNTPYARQQQAKLLSRLSNKPLKVQEFNRLGFAKDPEHFQTAFNSLGLRYFGDAASKQAIKQNASTAIKSQMLSNKLLAPITNKYVTYSMGTGLGTQALGAATGNEALNTIGDYLGKPFMYIDAAYRLPGELAAMNMDYVSRDYVDRLFARHGLSNSIKNKYYTKVDPTQYKLNRAAINKRISQLSKAYPEGGTPKDFNILFHKALTPLNKKIYGPWQGTMDAFSTGMGAPKDFRAITMSDKAKADAIKELA